MYKALYRAYRPETFDQLLGQEHIVKILRNQLASDKVSHAYLFCGTRGTGKTTTARLLAKGLNCTGEGERPCGQCSNCRSISEGTYMDVIEIDAASNRGIDEIRELRESVNYPPMLGGKKIYIIDEVHMLTAEAFNALLKTLEEPPEYVVFVLATTEPQKLPATILSRCLRLDFRRVSEKVISDGMKKICQDMGIDVTDSALRIIAANADGSVRDGLSILDQCISGEDGQVDVPTVLEYLGASGEDVLTELTEHVIRGRAGEAMSLLAQILESGKDSRQIIRDWTQHYRNLLMAKFIRDPQDTIDLSVENIDRIRSQAQIMEPEEISRGIMELSKTMNEARWSPQPRILLELCVVTLASASANFKAPPTMPPPTPQKPAQKATPKQEKAVESPAPKQETPADQPAPKAEAAEEKPAEPPAPEAEAGEQPVPEQVEDLMSLWDQVFADGSAEKNSMYLIRSNSMLTAMDDDTFTVMVSGDVNLAHTENNRKLIEGIMEKRTGRRRVMNIEQKPKEKEEISVEETAAQVSELIGVPVEIE